jgi:hypothetical protein
VSGLESGTDSTLVKLLLLYVSSPKVLGGDTRGGGYLLLVVVRWMFATVGYLMCSWWRHVLVVVVEICYSTALWLVDHRVDNALGRTSFLLSLVVGESSSMDGVSAVMRSSRSRSQLIEPLGRAPAWPPIQDRFHRT